MLLFLVLLVSNYMELHALTWATCSCVLLTYIVIFIQQFVSSDECIVSAAYDIQVQILSPSFSVFLQSFLIFGAYYCTALDLLGRNFSAFYPLGL